jgi:hypothetical protein
MIAVKHLLRLMFPSSVLAFIGLSFALATMFAAMGIFEKLKGRNSYSVGKILRNTALMGAVPATVTVIIHLAAVYLQRVFNQLDATTQNETLLAAFVLFAGTMGFFTKLIRQFWYGLVELIAALLFVRNAIAGIDPAHPNQLAVQSAVLASLYVVVRGLTNMTEGSLGKIENFEDFIDKLFARLGVQAKPSASRSPQTRHTD